MILWNERLRAAGIHFGLSALVGAIAALFVFAILYPYPYREVSGGRELFMLLVGVDVVMGPLITLCIFNTRKPRAELRRDLAIVVLLQLSALGYGLWTVAVARPVHLVFEFDRFRVVHAIDVPEEQLGREPKEVRAMPWTGPTLLAVRPFRSQQENLDATLAALQGLPLAARPDLWEPYDAARARVLQAAKPVAELKSRLPARAPEVDKLLREKGLDGATLAYLPLVSRKLFWTALVDARTADVVAYLPLDPY